MTVVGRSMNPDRYVVYELVNQIYVRTSMRVVGVKAPSRWGHSMRHRPAGVGSWGGDINESVGRSIAQYISLDRSPTVHNE